MHYFFEPNLKKLFFLPLLMAASLVAVAMGSCAGSCGCTCLGGGGAGACRVGDRMGVGSSFSGSLSAAGADLTVGGGVLSDGFSEGSAGFDDGGISDGGGGGSSYCRVV